MGIFKTKKNKKFSYSPRYWDDKGEGNPYQMEHKFDKYRTTVGKNKGLKSTFNDAIDDLKNRSDRNVNRRIIWIVAVLVFIFLYLIDFDLSIFFTRS
ncbi:riboflavin synthase subunit beta [Aquimarina sp. D1M17]|uniref:riboflavin synthase subunit beta n=1 Tax=Aquimarina acroporae TaxID=2937283 RepID=UPI0020BE0A8E|nr:riboflavin synthase subunit beta [Aquimarina acroporae]MCK8522794.1 riboflavin synthase subunit beta [Aquimarina acroporae]